MEGRARASSGHQSWAYLIPMFGSSLALFPAGVFQATRVPFFTTGVVVGVAWQLLYRRDLTSRLTLMASLLTISIVAALATRAPIDRKDMNTDGLYWIGILIALIFTEQFQRSRDRRRDRVPGPAPAVSERARRVVDHS